MGFYRYIQCYKLNDVSKLEEIAQLIRDILEDQSYTHVESYEFMNWKPEIRRNQHMNSVDTWYGELAKSPYLTNSESPDFGGFHIRDTYGVWGHSVGANFINSNDTIEFYTNGFRIFLTTDSKEHAWWVVEIEGKPNKKMESYIR